MRARLQYASGGPQARGAQCLQPMPHRQSRLGLFSSGGMEIDSRTAETTLARFAAGRGMCGQRLYCLKPQITGVNRDAKSFAITQLGRLLPDKLMPRFLWLESDDPLIRLAALEHWDIATRSAAGGRRPLG